MPNESDNESNPFSSVCLFMADSFHSLTLSQLIKSHGFSVTVFGDFRRMMAWLEQNPLVAAVICQSCPNANEGAVRSCYKGPIHKLSGERDAMMKQLAGVLREISRNQLKIQDPSALRVLKTLNRFLKGGFSPLLLTGQPAPLQLALEYLTFFSRTSPVILSSPEDVPDPSPETWFATWDLFDRPLPWQQTWGLRFSEAATPHVILQPGSLLDLDQRYGTNTMDEPVYELLSLRTIDVNALGKFSFEEICVQAPETTEPRVVFDAFQQAAEGGSDVVSSPIAGQDGTPAKGGIGSFVRGLFGGKPR